MRRAFDALNAGDPYVFLEAYDPEVELWASSSWGFESGMVRGAKEVELWFAREFAGWGNPHYEPEQLIEWGPHVVVLGHWVGEGRRSGVPLRSAWLTVFSFADGKIVSIAQLGRVGGLGEREEAP